MTVYSIYLFCLVVGLVFTLLSVALGHFFGGHGDHVGGSGGHAEAGADSSDMPGISIFSPTIIAAFITAFGGFGIIHSPTRLLSARRFRSLLRLPSRAAFTNFWGICSVTRRVPVNRMWPN